MSMRPNVKCGLGSAEPKPINENTLGLLIVLNKTGRRKPSIGLKQIDGNRSDDNETLAFSYSDTDDDSSEDDSWSEDRRAYLSELNDEYLLAMSLDDKWRHQFEPCRKMKPAAAHNQSKRKHSIGKRRNVYKRRDRDENTRGVREGAPRKMSLPEDSRPNRYFWSRSPSWSAIGRFFGKLKHGHWRNSDERIRKLSLQTMSSAADTDDGSGGSTGEYRTRYSSYDDPAAFLKQVQIELLSGEFGQSGDVSHLKVVSKNADDLQFTVTSTGRESLAVCKEYFSRLTCYDAMPDSSQVVAVDARTPMEEVFNILRRHHTMGAVVWNSSARPSDATPTRRLCDIGSLVHLFWPYFADASSSRHVSKQLRRPVADFFAAFAGEGDENKENAFESGLSAEVSLMDAARLFCHQTRIHIPRAQETRNGQHRRCWGRFLLPLLNEVTGDVIDTLSANDILRFLSKELSKFDLTSAFDRTIISEIGRFSQTDAATVSSHEREKWWLYSDYTLKRASSMLIESEMGVLPVFQRSTSSKPSYETMLSMADVVDLVAKSGYCSDVALSKRLDELLVDCSRKDVPVFDTTTSVAKVLKTFASSTSDHGSWDSLLPVAVIIDDKGDFAGFLEAEDLLTIVLSLDERENEQTDIGVSRMSSRERRDSGVGDEELPFSEDMPDSGYVTRRFLSV